MHDGPDDTDPAVALLLRKGPPPPATGITLDLVCHDGAIVCGLAAQAPDSTFWAVDVDRAARDMTRRRAAEAALDNVAVVAPEAVPEAERFDAIYCRVPESLADPDLDRLLQTWLARLVPHEENPLSRSYREGSRGPHGGRAFLVLERRRAVALQRRLQRDGFLTERFASNRRHRVLVVAGTLTSAREVSETGGPM